MFKRMQELPTMLARCWLVGLSDEVIALLSPRRPCAMRVRGPNKVGRAVLTDPSSLCYVRRSLEQKKCWELLTQKFDRFKTLSNNSQQHAKTCNIQQCYIAGNFFPTACLLIGYCEITWHLTIKLLPGKISERATLQNLWRQRVTVHCYPQMLTDDRRYSEV